MEITVGGFDELKLILFYILNSSISPLQLYNHNLNHIFDHIQAAILDYGTSVRNSYNFISASTY